MAKIRPHYDVLIVGGGAIGLSLAWELAQSGVKVGVVDRGELGQEASWAGAGMIPPGPEPPQWQQATPLEQLAGFSGSLHASWHEKLQEQTGIDNGYRKSGGIYLADSPAAAMALHEKTQRWQQLGIDCHTLEATTLADLEPALQESNTRITAAQLVPGERQIRNPRHIRALVTACRLQGVELIPGIAVHEFKTDAQQITAAITNDGPISADRFCLTAGCWSGEFAAQLGLRLSVRPVRGQIVLLTGHPGKLGRILIAGPRYLVPRPDGRILIGSTEEEVGFRKQNTVAGVAGLLDFAASLAPSLSQLPIEQTWSGLRPATADGLPYLGKLPRYENGWIAAGHFRSGLQLSPGTAVLMAAMMLGKPLAIDVSGFVVNRHAL